MMGVVLQNALLVDFDPPKVEMGELRIVDGRIEIRGPRVRVELDDEVMDCGGAVVMPGLVNGHTHLYSALAVGMPLPPQPPRNFLEILQFVWWRLDCALDAEAIEVSARVGAMDAARCGTTTLIDHHASPNCIGGSLDLVERGIQAVGLRGVLCYETTDRHGHAGREEGLAENRRYLERHKVPPSRAGGPRHAGRFAGLVGAHASFTLEDDALADLAGLAEEFDTGVHIHVAEDPCDADACRREHGCGLIDRLDRFGLLRPASILTHGTHLDAAAIERVNAVGSYLAHNPRSNMNNAVGYTPVRSLRCPVMLGTDGIGGDMLSEARHGWFKSRDAHAGLTPDGIVQMLANAARRASAALGVTLGRLEREAAADIIITDYVPGTPLNVVNLSGHLLFGIGPQHVVNVMVDGHWVVRRRMVLNCDEFGLRRKAATTAARLWQRMDELPRTE